MERDGPRQGVAGFALVEFGGDSLAQFGVLELAQGEDCSLNPPDFMHGGCKVVLLAISRKLSQDQRRGHHAVAHRRDDLVYLVPVALDAVLVEAVAEQRCKPAVAGLRFARVQPQNRKPGDP